jgi:hypothetical protein
MGSKGLQWVTTIVAVALAVSALAAVVATGPADAGTVTITGHVLNYDGTPQRSDTSGISAWRFDGQPTFFNMGGVGWTMPGQTDSSGPADDGSFTISGLVADPGHDCLVYAYDLPSLCQMLVLWGLDFSTQSDFTLQPSQTTLVLKNWYGTYGGSNAALPPAAPEVWVAGPGGAALTTTELTKGGAGVVAAPAPDFNEVVVSRAEGRWGEYTSAVDWISEGAALVPAPAGKTAAETVTLDWDAAHHAHLAGTPTQRSVAPGGSVRLILSGWPAGETARFVGLAYGNGSIHEYAQTFTSTGASSTSVVTLTVPDDVPPGAGYEIETIRSDDPASHLSLWSVADVCTLKASQTTIRRGQAVVLSGRLARNARGAPVTVFARHTPAGEPATIAAKGWTAVGSFPSTSYQAGPGWRGAKFVSRSLKPDRTTWYVARCDGVFTPVVKVAVH